MWCKKRGGKGVGALALRNYVVSRWQLTAVVLCVLLVLINAIANSFSPLFRLPPVVCRHFSAPCPSPSQSGLRVFDVVDDALGGPGQDVEDVHFGWRAITVVSLHGEEDDVVVDVTCVTVRHCGRCANEVKRKALHLLLKDTKTKT